MNRVRAFVAADLPESVVGELAGLQERLRRSGVSGRWVRPERMHVTLRFLGELEPARFDAVRKALEGPLGGTDRIDLVPEGMGVFPHPSRPRVLWVGLSGDVDELGRLALELEDRLAALGLPRERRPFRAHITLARASREGDLRAVARAARSVGGFRGTSFSVTHLTLYESRLRPGGPDYIPRQRIPLGRAAVPPPQA